MSKLRILVAVLALGAFAAPAAAQFSDSYNFFKAVKDRDGAKATSLLAQPGTTLANARDYDSGDTALIMVTRRRDVPWMNLMLSKGANPNARDKSGNTALIVAANIGFIDGVQVLLARGADPNAKNDQGETALIRAVQLRDANSARLLLAGGANPDATDNVAGYSARDYAQQDRRAGMIMRLIKEADDKKKAPAPTPASTGAN